MGPFTAQWYLICFKVFLKFFYLYMYVRLLHMCNIYIYLIHKHAHLFLRGELRSRLKGSWVYNVPLTIFRVWIYKRFVNGNNFFFFFWFLFYSVFFFLQFIIMLSWVGAFVCARETVSNLVMMAAKIWNWDTWMKKKKKNWISKLDIFGVNIYNIWK